MTWEEAVDAERAVAQWAGLQQALKTAGARVVTLDVRNFSSAMTFTRDIALVPCPGRAVVLRNDGPRGQAEPPAIAGWFERLGYSVDMLPPKQTLDGGNLLPTHDGRYLVGLKRGTAGRPERYLARLLRLIGSDRECIGVPLSNRRYLHLDMALADLAGRGWLVYLEGLGEIDFRRPAWQDVFADRPIIEVTQEEAEKLACNVVVVGDTVITGHASPRLERLINKLGLAVHVTPLDEFRKAGGGAHCLTLEIDGNTLTDTNKRKEESVVESAESP